jgi:hypothetical protein
MANTVVLKRSSVPNKTPTTNDLALGELALNTNDGNLFFKRDVSGTQSILSVATLTGTQTLTNKSLTSPVITGTLTAGGTAGTNGQVLQSTGTGVQWVTPESGAGSVGLSEILVTGITTTPTTLISFSTTTYRGAKYTIQITNDTAYSMYEFLVMHDGTTVYFPYSATAYSGDSGGNHQNYFNEDYLDTLASTKIQLGNTNHALRWSISAGNLVFSAVCSAGTLSIKGAALLIKA